MDYSVKNQWLSCLGFQAVLILLAFLQEARADVRACILDGGGRQPLCTSRDYFNDVIAVGGRRSSTSILIPHSSPERCAANSTPPVVRDPPPESSRPPEVRRMTSGDVGSCWPGASASDVCTFYSPNHGSSSGIALDTDERFLEPGRLARAISENGCETDRFVLNNCFSGGFNQVVFDRNSRYIPGRCGVTATTSDLTAHGFSLYTNNTRSALAPSSEGDSSGGFDMSPSVTRRRDRVLGMNARTAGFIPPFTHLFSRGVIEESDHSMDSGFFNAISTVIPGNPASGYDFPRSTSDEYIDRLIGRGRVSASIRSRIAESAGCDRQNSELVGAAWRESISSILSASGEDPRFGSTEERARVRRAMGADLDRMRRQLVAYAQRVCDYWAESSMPADAENGCPPRGDADAKLQHVLARVAAIRASIASRERAIQARGQECDAMPERSSAQSRAKEACFRQLTAQVRETKELLNNNRFAMRFALFKDKIQNVQTLFRSGTRDQVMDYLLLRQCELGNMNEPAPRTLP